MADRSDHPDNVPVRDLPHGHGGPDDGDLWQWDPELERCARVLPGAREPGIYYDVPEDEYYSDPAFSQSQAKVLRVSPAKYKWQLEHGGETATRSLELGKLAHTRILGVGAQAVVIPPELLSSSGAIAGKDAKAFVARTLAAGNVPVKAAQLAEVEAMAEMLMSHEEARALLTTPGHAEASMWWDDPLTGIRCRGRVDWLTTLGEAVCNTDYKSTADAGPFAFAKSVANYGYHVQAAAYELGLRVGGGHENVVTRLIAQETKPPYFVAVYSLSDADLDIGLDHWHAALAQLAWCREHDEWPGYAGGELVLPGWS